MTVIAWDGKKLVADGRSTRGMDLCSNNENKFHAFDHPNLGSCIGAFAGAVMTIGPWIEHIEQFGFAKFELPMEEGPMGSPYEATGIVITEDGEVLEIDPSGLWATVTVPTAWGSGAHIAQHFLNTGYSALYAVEEACKSNLGCGGTIRSYDPEECELKVERQA